MVNLLDVFPQFIYSPGYIGVLSNNALVVIDDIDTISETTFNEMLSTFKNTGNKSLIFIVVSDDTAFNFDTIVADYYNLNIYFLHKGKAFGKFIDSNKKAMSAFTLISYAYYELNSGSILDLEYKDTRDVMLSVDLQNSDLTISALIDSLLTKNSILHFPFEFKDSLVLTCSLDELSAVDLAIILKKVRLSLLNRNQGLYHVAHSYSRLDSSHRLTIYIEKRQKFAHYMSSKTVLFDCKTSIIHDCTLKNAGNISSNMSHYTLFDCLKEITNEK